MSLWFGGVTDATGAKDPIARNAMISSLRKQAEASNVGTPALIVILVPKGTEDAVMDRLVPVLNERNPA